MVGHASGLPQCTALKRAFSLFEVIENFAVDFKEAC